MKAQGEAKVVAVMVDIQNVFSIFRSFLLYFLIVVYIKIIFSNELKKTFIFLDTCDVMPSMFLF